MALLKYLVTDKIAAYISGVYKINPQVFSSIPSLLGNKFEQYDENDKGKYGKIVLVSEPLTGIDLPVLVKQSESDRPIIAIVAKDPLRNEKDVMLPTNQPGNAVIGTPFALHYKCSKKCYPQTDVYRKIIKGLLSSYDVYITDAHKIYPRKKGLDKKDEIELLEKEINIINTDNPRIRLAITFGSDAKEYFGKIGLNTPVINLLHPSQQNWDHWKQWIFEQAFGESNNGTPGFYTRIAKSINPIRSTMFEDQNADMPQIISDVVCELVGQVLNP